MTDATGGDRKPLIYSCSGCSSAAQMANALAVRADRSGRAEMSCIAGVGGEVPSLVRLARAGRPILALDGCELGCARNCLAKVDVSPTAHMILTRHGVRKLPHRDYPADQAEEVYEKICAELEAISFGNVK